MKIEVNERDIFDITGSLLFCSKLDGGTEELKIIANDITKQYINKIKEEEIKGEKK